MRFFSVSTACRSFCRINGSYWAYLSDVEQAGSTGSRKKGEVRGARAKTTSKIKKPAKGRGRRVINIVNKKICKSGVACSRALGHCDQWAQSQIANNRHTDKVHLMYFDEYAKNSNKKATK